MNEFEALVRYVHRLHHHMGKLFVRELADQTDAWYRPTPGGLLEEYLELVDDFGQRFGAGEDRDDFYPTGTVRCEGCGCVAPPPPSRPLCFTCASSRRPPSEKPR